MDSERLVSMTPLPAGWRAVYASDPGIDKGDLEALPDEYLFHVRPVAALARVEVCDPPGRSDGIRYECINPVTVSEGDHFSWVDDNEIALLGPGEEIPDWVRAEAIRQIQRERERIAELVAKRAEAERAA